MAIRSTRSQVTFTGPFELPEIDGVLPAGTYDIETDEEMIEAGQRTVFRRVATLLRVTSGGTTQTYTIKPEQLDAALARDGSAELGR
jgi:hypothetical protein